MPIIKLKKSIIPSCDINSLEKLSKLVKATFSVKGVGAYKIGFELVISFGIENVVKTIRKITKLPIIYDHQKAGTDIPEMGEKFVKVCKLVDAIILFPQAGPETEVAWIKAAQQAKMPVIIGGEMTHQAYLKEAGGFIDDNAPKRMYEIAASMGVTDFVIPGNKPERALEYVKIIKNKIKNPVFYSPGLITQGGSISDLAKKLEMNASKMEASLRAVSCESSSLTRSFTSQATRAFSHATSWHAIIGRAIYEAKDMKKACEELTKEL